MVQAGRVRAQRRGRRILPAGPRACLHALRSLCSVGVAGGDTYAMLHTPSLWPHAIHEDIKDAWAVIAEGSFEVAAHIVAAALNILAGLKLVPGFRVRLPTGADQVHPPFVRGSGRNPAFLRLRDFTDTLVLTAEATLARDAAGSPLGRGKPHLPEQRALRQYLGLPKSASVTRARLKSEDVCQLLSNVGIEISGGRLTHLISLVGSPYPDAAPLVRSEKQPVPYLEAERLLLSSLSSPSLGKLLQQPPHSRLNRMARERPPVPPPPPWQSTYTRMAHSACEEPTTSGGWEASTVSLDRTELERRWLHGDVGNALDHTSC